MLTLLTPMWLLGLSLLPVIRWLHRGGRHRRTVLVSRMVLWRGAAASSPAAGARRPPDPAWRRRALLAALLFVALSGPQLPAQRTKVTLWVDDSISMLTREAQGTRLALGLAQARALLADVAQGEAELRTLSEPWRRLGAPTEAAIATLVASAGQQEPAAPPEALLRGDGLHWLVTDGADAALLDWPAGRQPDRLIQVAGVTRNVGLVRLSARRNLHDPDRIDLLLKITNGGDAAESREVGFAIAAGEMVRSTHRLDPGASALVNAGIPTSAAVRATLQPGDALAEDDQIVLDLAPLRRRRVAIDPACASALVAAVGTHPALVVASDKAADVDAVLDCGGRGAASGVATVRVVADRTPTLTQAPARWSSSVAESRRVRLDAAPLQLAARLQARPADAVLLAIGDEPVIIGRAGGPELLETSLDFAALGATRGAAIPLLVNLMFESVLGSRLLDEIAITERGPSAVSVVPAKRVAANASAQVSGEARILGDWARQVLVIAVLTLLWEIIALGRQWLSLRGPVEATSE